MNRPFGYTVFCDDIRDEVRNKKTYVGVYSADVLFSGDLPFILPTFGIAIHYLEPVDWPIEAVKIKVTAPGQDDDEMVIVDADISPERQISDGDFGDKSELRYRAHIMHFRLSPLPIFKEGRIKVRAYFGNEEVKLGSVNVRRMTEVDNKSFG